MREGSIPREVWELDTGALWLVNTTMDVVYLPAESRAASATTPEVFVSEVRTSEGPHDLNAPLVLPHDSRWLELQFAAPVFGQSQLAYRFRLPARSSRSP